MRTTTDADAVKLDRRRLLTGAAIGVAAAGLGGVLGRAHGQTPASGAAKG